MRRGSELPGTLAGAWLYPAARSGRHTGQCILSVLGMKMHYSGRRYHLCWRCKPEDTGGNFLDKIIKIKYQEISSTVLPEFSCGFGPTGKKMDVIMFLFWFKMIFYQNCKKVNQIFSGYSLKLGFKILVSFAGPGSPRCHSCLEEKWKWCWPDLNWRPLTRSRKNKGRKRKSIVSLVKGL